MAAIISVGLMAASAIPKIICKIMNIANETKKLYNVKIKHYHHRKRGGKMKHRNHHRKRGGKIKHRNYHKKHRKCIYGSLVIDLFVDGLIPLAFWGFITYGLYKSCLKYQSIII